MSEHPSENHVQLQQQQIHYNGVTPQQDSSPTHGTTSTSSLLLDQIAHLLNLAQTLMRTAKEEREQPRLPTLRSNNLTRRTIRLQATPYQRAVNEAARVASNVPPAGRNSTATTIPTAVNAISGQQQNTELNAAQFCDCAECLSYRTRRRCAANAIRGSDKTATSCSSPDKSCHPQQNRNFQCSICLESYLPQRPMATLCGHIFCRLCIFECLNRQGKCPICNRKLNVTNVFRVFF